MKVDKLFVSLCLSAKSVAKVALLSRKSGVFPQPSPGRGVVVMGNGPSLGNVIEDERDKLLRYDLLAVNFFANTPVFRDLRPKYYVIADPLFFMGETQSNMSELWRNLRSVDWKMTLFVPARCRKSVLAGLPANVKVSKFNFVGTEGFACLCDALCSLRLAMPRPRNVLIPSIMCSLWMGYKDIYVVGADHSWTKTLEVEDDNTVVSVQPHFYRDGAEENERVRSLYKNIRLHELMYSFYVAFKSYFDVDRYARKKGARIINATKGSFIDAFERGTL